MDEIAAAAARACLSAAERLSLAGVAPEALAEFVPERRVLLVRRTATMRQLGEVWRLGPLLLGSDGSLYAAGTATRAAERGRPGYQSLSREERRDIAAAALKGGYAEGTPVNFDAAPLPLTSEALAILAPTAPIGVCNDAVRVRWRPGASLEGARRSNAFSPSGSSFW